MAQSHASATSRYVWQRHTTQLSFKQPISLVSLIVAWCVAPVRPAAVHSEERMQELHQQTKTYLNEQRAVAVSGICVRNSALMQSQACGYRVLVTQLTPDSVPIHDIDFTQPTAFILGNEVDGAPCSCSELSACPSHRQHAGFVIPAQDVLLAARCHIKTGRVRNKKGKHMCIPIT